MQWIMDALQWPPDSGHRGPGERLECSLCGSSEWFICWDAFSSHVHLRCAGCPAVFDVAQWPHVLGTRRWDMPQHDPLEDGPVLPEEGQVKP